jgi:histidyl-tRNA synthetase
MTKDKKLRPELPSGFIDRKGNELILKDRLTEIIKKNFQLYGYEPLSTPGFEISENIGKFLPDEDRPNSGVFGFKDGKNWISLIYDLTAPLARYFSANETLISKPFKRYQVGNVWRNEKPGPGRFREFTQIDADIVGTKNILADVEMTVLLADSLNKCGLDKEEFIIRVSNRKCFFGMLVWVGISNEKQRIAITRAVDKYDRLGIKGVASLLGKGRNDKSGDFTIGVGLNQKQIEKITEYIEDNTVYDNERKNMTGSARFAPLGSYDDLSPLYAEGLKELGTIFDNTEFSEFKNQIVYSPTLVRGIEYYTGNIFEANLLFKVKNQKGQEVEFGSVGGGGRYDTLVSKFSNNPAPAVGVSIGLDRLLVGIQQKDNFFKNNKIENAGPVVICLFEQTNMASYYKILNMLRSSGINSEIYSGDGGIKAQMKYADRRNSPAVILYGENEAKSGTVTIKNLNAGKKSSDEIKTRKDWKSNESAQATVKLENLINEIKKII